MDDSPRLYIAVIGTSDFNDHEFFGHYLYQWIRSNGPVDKIITGGWPGADKMVKEFAEIEEIDTLILYPKRSLHGKKAVRYADKAIVCQADHIVIFSTMARSERIASVVRWAKEMGKPFTKFQLIETDDSE